MLQKHEDAAGITLSPAQGAADAVVIWLHGLGADGNDFVPLVPELRLPPAARIRFIFPHAPVQAVTINNGYRMRAWYDIRGLQPGSAEDDAGIRRSAAMLGDLVKREVASGVASQRVVLAGFSQGGAVALHAGLRHDAPLGGILALSTYLPLRATLAAEANPANATTPIFMCHGAYDQVIALAFAEGSRDALLGNRHQVEWHQYPMAHEVSGQEIADISRWLAARLPALR